MSDRKTTRRPLRKDAELNRQRVMQAARDVFASRGLGATLTEIAHHAGVGAGTLYRRFATKESLLEAVFEDGMNELALLAERALRYDDSWQGFVWFVEQMCELIATDRGKREIALSTVYGGRRMGEARARLAPLVSKIVERAQDDGYLRPDLGPTDMPIFGLLAGSVSEYAGHVNVELWRRYVGILLDGVRRRSDQSPLTVRALEEHELDAAMREWRPAGNI